MSAFFIEKLIKKWTFILDDAAFHGAGSRTACKATAVAAAAAVAVVAMKRVSRQFSEIMRCVAAGKKYIITNLARPLDCMAEISMSLP